MKKIIGWSMLATIGGALFVAYPIFVLGLSWIEVVIGLGAIVFTTAWIVGAVYLTV